jgi:DNA primase
MPPTVPLYPVSNRKTENMASDFTQTVKEQADIVKIIGDYVRLRKAGAQNYTGLCPFHKEKTPSFSVHAGRQFFNCFGCHEHGDVFTFVQKIENVGFSEAVRTVAQKCGIPLPKRDFASPEEAAEHRQRGKLLDLHEAATAWFEDQLRSPEGALAREYLSGRGLSPDGIAKFRIGFAPDNFHALRERLQSMADQEALRQSGLFSWKEQEDGSPGPIYARFRKRIMFPIANESGRVIAFTARTLDTGEKAGPRYLNSPETPLYSKSHVLFNLDKAKQAIRSDGGVVLVEGQMDCISVFLAGIPNVVATSGTAFTESHLRVLSRLLGDRKRAIANFDSDAAGIAAFEKYILPLIGAGFEVRVLVLGDGLDPDRFIRDRGARAYAEALRSAPTFERWLIDRSRERFPSRDPKSIAEAFRLFLLPYLKAVNDPIQRDAFVNDVAQALLIDPAVARGALRDAINRQRGSVANVPSYPFMPAEQTLIRAFSARRSSEGYLIAEGAYHEHNADLAVLRSDLREIIDDLRNRPDGSDPLSAVKNEEQRRMLVDIFTSVHDREPDANEVDEAILALRRESLHRQQRITRAAIALAERAANHTEVLSETHKLQAIVRRLRELD